MKHLSTITLTLAFTVGSALAPYAAEAEFSDAALSCRAAIAKNSVKLVQTLGKVQAKCRAGRVSGKLDPFTDCDDLADADPRGKAEKAADKLRDAVGGDRDRCDALVPSDLLYYGCPAPCDVETPAIASFSDVADCVVCLAEQEVVAMHGASQGTPVVPLTKPDAKCNGAIAKSQGKYLSSLLKERSKCQKSMQADGAIDPTACADADPKSKLAGARTKGEDGIDKKCAVATLANLDSCTTSSVAALQTCVLDDAEARAATLLQSYYVLGAPTWTDVLDVFAVHGCASTFCHGGAAQSGGLGGLDNFDNGHADLVGVAPECGSTVFTERVAAGDVGASFLVAKLLGTQDCGVIMPIGDSPLGAADLGAIMAWIIDGAPKN